MQLLVGTSGFSYGEWRGIFYPERLPDSEMLGFYAQHLPTVEINNTFYRMPQPELLRGWFDKVPAGFRFALKAPRRITHVQRLAHVGDAVAHLCAVAAGLEQKLGPILFQLPPFLRCDTGLLREFLSSLPEACEPALEFRHPSWFNEEVYTALADRRAALCGGDLDEVDKSPPLVATADFGYLRLRRPDYDEPAIGEWAEKLGAQPWQRVYAYFKHESLGPVFAQLLSHFIDGTERPDLAAARARQQEASANSKPVERDAAKQDAEAPRAAKRARKTQHAAHSEPGSVDTPASRKLKARAKR